MFKSNDTHLYDIKELVSIFGIDTTQMKKMFADIPVGEKGYSVEIINAVLFCQPIHEIQMTKILSKDELEEAFRACGYELNMNELERVYRVLHKQIVYSPVREIRKALKTVVNLSELYDYEDKALNKPISVLKETIKPLIDCHFKSKASSKQKIEDKEVREERYKKLVETMQKKLAKSLDDAYEEALEIKAHNITSSINVLRRSIHLPATKSN